MTSSTPEVSWEVLAGGQPVVDGQEVVGRGDLQIRVRGLEPGSPLPLRVGDRQLEVPVGEEGVATWVGKRWLSDLAGELVLAAAGHQLTLKVRPDKLTMDEVIALIQALEDVAAGLASSAGGLTSFGATANRDQELHFLDEAVGLAAEAAPAIRRRPLHLPRVQVRAVPSERGVRTPADARWLATHPLAEARAAAGGRPVGVVRQRFSDLDLLENRGVLRTYDLLEERLGELAASLSEEQRRLQATRPAREAFLTASSNLWEELDQPRQRALLARQQRVGRLRDEVRDTRRRSGLPDLRPRSARMVRTPRVDAEPAYWRTFQASRLAERQPEPAPRPVLAPLRSLDALWELWVAVVSLQALERELGPPDRGGFLESGWFTELKRGVIARWQTPDREIVLEFEPEIGPHGPVRRLNGAAPLRPDLVMTLRWASGVVDLHVLDAKFRRGEGGGAPWEALHDLWWRYGEGIGDPSGMPLVRSLWVVAPGDALLPLTGGMLHPSWPVERLRGGCCLAKPGRAGTLDRLLLTLLRPP